MDRHAFNQSQRSVLRREEEGEKTKKKQYEFSMQQLIQILILHSPLHLSTPPS